MIFIRCYYQCSKFFHLIEYAKVANGSFVFKQCYVSSPLHTLSLSLSPPPTKTLLCYKTGKKISTAVKH